MLRPVSLYAGARPGTLARFDTRDALCLGTATPACQSNARHSHVSLSPSMKRVKWVMGQGTGGFKHGAVVKMSIANPRNQPHINEFDFTAGGRITVS